MKPRLLDLFCGAGGAAMGYHRAGFEVVGVDIEPQPNYPFEFVQADALEVLEGRRADLLPQDFAARHASPVCHDWSGLSSVTGTDGTAWLLRETLECLQSIGGPWVVENVVGAPLAQQDTLDGSYGVRLCGKMFTLSTLRHRLFESSFPIATPYHPRHDDGEIHYSPSGHGHPNRSRDFIPALAGPGYADRCRKALGIDWMNRDELAQAIPPSYTQWIGESLIRHLRAAA